MAATFLLIRHAAHIHLDRTLTGRLDGVPLSDAGREQATRLGLRLLLEPIDLVVTSPRERARETAAAIAMAQGLVPEAASALDEIDFGKWTGVCFADLDGDAAWNTWNTHRAIGIPPGGEAAAAAQARAMGFLHELAATHTDRAIAIISHCDIIRSAVCAVLGLSLDHLLRFDVDAASVTRIMLGSHGGRLISLNERTI